MTKNPKHHHVYVVLLNSDVLTKEKKFQEANPGCVPGWPCLYVGMTGLTPERRFENHKRGYKGNKYVERYGERLAMEFLEHGNPMAFRRWVYSYVKSFTDFWITKKSRSESCVALPRPYEPNTTTRAGELTCCMIWSAVCWISCALNIDHQSCWLKLAMRPPTSRQLRKILTSENGGAE
jgi:hypothetical protein